MNVPDLSIFVEFGVGLAGFSGVVVAFGSRNGELGEYDRFRVIQLLLSTLIPAFLGLVPVVAVAFGLDDEATCRVAGLLVMAAIAGNMIVAVTVARGMSPTVRANLSPAIWRVALVSSAVFFAWNGLNLAGWPWGLRFGPVVAAMAWLLLMGSVMFFRLLLVRLGDGDDDV